jgi:hypothetical protein
VTVLNEKEISMLSKNPLPKNPRFETSRAMQLRKHKKSRQMQFSGTAAWEW